MKISFKNLSSFLLLSTVTSCSIMAQQKALSEGLLKVGVKTYEVRAGRGNQIINIVNEENFPMLAKLDRENKGKSEIIPIGSVSINESGTLKGKTRCRG